MEVTGYKFNTEQEATEARDLCDAHFGIPLSPDAVTQHTVGINYSELDGFWYIRFDSVQDFTSPALGEPTTFEVNEEEI